MISGDLQPAFDWVEKGEVQPEGEGRTKEREDTVQLVDTLRDICI